MWSLVEAYRSVLTGDASSRHTYAVDDGWLEA